MKKYILKNLLYLFLFIPICLNGQTLIGHWPFSGNANDISGNGLNGVVTNATLTTGQAGQPNTAYYFNGTNAHIDVPFNQLMNMTSWTLMAVVKPMGYYSGACQDNAIIWHAYDWANNHYDLVFFDNPYDNSCNTFSPGHDFFRGEPAGAAGPASIWQSANPVQLNTWYCVATTYANDTVKVYIDGVLSHSVPFPNQYNYTQNDTLWGLGFGYDPPDPLGYPYWFNGIIDDIQIYNGALTESQIYNLCSAVAIDTVNFAYDFSSNINCNDVLFTANHISGNTATQFLWLFGDNTTGNTNPITHMYNQPGNYTVTLIATDSAGHMDTVTHSITVSIANFNYTINSLSTSCKTVQLNANYINGDTANQYTWYFGDNSPSSTGSTTTHTYSQSGTYTVMLVLANASGCTDTITTTINISTNINYSINYTQTNCKTAELQATYISGDTSIQYIWLFGDNSPAGNGNPITHIYPENGTYVVKLAVSNNQGCTDTIMTTVVLLFNMNYAIADSSIDCKTAQLRANYINGDTAAQLLWLFADNETATANPIIHTFPNTGQNTAGLVLINALGCRDTISYGFTINYQLFADFTFTPLTPERNIPTQFYNASSPAATKFHWNFGDNTSSDEENPLKQYNLSGTYHVCLTAADSNDCTATVCKDVAAVVTELIDIPDAFSPNGDGKNDILYARGYGIKTMSLVVYNRWGQKVFNSSDLNKGWDGTYKGTAQPSEVYAYVLDAVFQSGKAFHKQGNITIVR